MFSLNIHVIETLCFFIYVKMYFHLENLPRAYLEMPFFSWYLRILKINFRGESLQRT